MFNQLSFALVLAMGISTTAVAQSYTDDSQLEAFLLSGGITPEAIDMQWYLSCQVYAVSIAGAPDQASAWTFMSERNSRRLETRIDRLNQTDPEWSRRVQCEARPAFADAAHPASRIAIETVSVTIGGVSIPLNAGDSIRYHNCQKVLVLGTAYIQKAGC